MTIRNQTLTCRVYLSDISVFQKSSEYRVELITKKSAIFISFCFCFCHDDVILTYHVRYFVHVITIGTLSQHLLHAV